MNNSTDLRFYESHMHTPLCGHAVGDPEEYAKVAARKGLAGIIVTCHNPLPGPPDPGIRMGVDRFDDYCDLVERARVAMEGVADVRLGLECDFIPGLEAFVEQVRRASHWYDGATPPPAPVTAASARALELVMADPGPRERLRANVRPSAATALDCSYWT